MRDSVWSATPAEVARSPMRLALMVFPALATVAGAVGCDQAQPGSDPGHPAAGFTVRDSGDIEIVENHAPEHPPGQFWTIDPEPEIVLGGGGMGTPNDEPGATVADSAQPIWEVSGLARLEDGRVAVLSTGNHRLFLFEPSGELSRVIGGRGDGPGEFTRPQHLQYLPPDTLAVWDYWFAPTSYFDTGGRLLGERTIDLRRLMEAAPGTNAESTVFPLPDGALVVVAGNEFPPGTPAPGFVRGPPSEFIRIGRSYSTRSLGSWEGLELWVPQEESPVPGFPTFMIESHLASGGDPSAIYISNGDTEDIHQFSLGGNLLRIIRRTRDPVPVTDAAQEAWESAFVAYWSQWGDLERELGMTTERFFAGMRREAFPPVAGLVVDTDGFLWVREWSASEVGMPDRWSVFGPDGRWLGVIPGLPDLMLCHRRLGPCWIDEEFLLAVRRDELGIERVEGYRIRRGGL